MATVEVKALSESGSVVSSQELTPTDVPEGVTTIKEVFSKEVQEDAARYATGYVESWADWSEVITTFNDIPGVNSVFELGAYRGQHMCPTAHLSVESGEEDSVADAVTEYYDGFNILEAEDGVVVVGFDSGAHLFGRDI